MTKNVVDKYIDLIKPFRDQKKQLSKIIIEKLKDEYKERLSRICDVMICLSIDEVKKSRFIAHIKAIEAVISLVIDLTGEF